MRNASFQTRRGFTLIELLLVIGIIAILASIVIVAINPTKQLGDARDAQRSSDVNALLNAVYQYSIDNNGAFPADVESATGTGMVICGTVDGTNPTSGCASVETELVSSGAYLVGIPNDPQNQNGYTVLFANDRITITATPEQADSISVTR